MSTETTHHPITESQAARPVQPTTDYGVVERPLSRWERLYSNGALRKALILAALALVWEVYARQLDNSLLFPTLSATVVALYNGIVSSGLLVKAGFSIKVLLMGYAAGLALATLLIVIAMTSRLGNDFLETLTSMFNPLPAIALLPLALLWFGLGNASLVFVLIHSVLWAVALKILIPAAFPSILTGLKMGWAFAWRTLIAAELVFGVSSGTGGLGWFIYENKNQLEIPAVFAGLFTVILIGLLVENLVFKTIEVRTVRKWGMQS